MRLASKLAIAACCFGSLTACPVDDRTLEPIEPSFSSGGVAGHNGAGEAGEGDGGEAASQNGGSSGQGGSQGGSGGTPMLGGSSGASGDSGNGGDAGSSTGGAPVGRCPDLDVNEVLDCDETLATNATFDSSVLPWVSESPNVVADWNIADAHDRTGSGSISVENSSSGSSLLGVRQCIPVTGDTAYNFIAEAFVPSEVPGAQAGLHLLAYDGEACSGTMIDHVQSNYIATGTGWRVAQKTWLLPANAKSVAVRLVCQKLSGEPTHVFYDNVLVNED